MDPWPHPTIRPSLLNGLVRKGLLRVRTEVQEWHLPEGEVHPDPSEGYIVSLATFHERGFAMPLHKFLHDLLHYYSMKLQHLNPSGI